MGTYVSIDGSEVVAMQWQDKDSTLSKVNLHDWVHNVDSSTIYGPASDFIMKDIAKNGGFAVPYKNPENQEYYPNKYLAIDGDWIIKHGDLDFTVMSNAAFTKLFK